MERTRDEVIRILHEQGARSVAELAQAVGVSEGAMRRHLDIMAAEGLIATRLERQPRGRPVTRYLLSEAGEEQSAAGHYARLLDRIYPALARLPREAVDGRSGEQLLEQLFLSVAEEVARSHASKVAGAGALDQRVEQVAVALREEGILNDVVDEGEFFRLRNIGCPYRSTAEEAPTACSADRHTIELLLGERVEQMSTIVDGHPTCEYLVHKRPGRDGVIEYPLMVLETGAPVSRRIAVES